MPSLRLGQKACGFLTLALLAATPAIGTEQTDTQTEQLSAAQSSDTSLEISPASLIDAMSKAVKSLNYEGMFVHAQGVNLTSMHILHASDIKGEFERLTALDGEEREVIRSNSLVTCIWPGSERVVVSTTKSRDVLPNLSIDLISSERYTFEHLPQDRVAGRDTYVVNVTPRDQYRYGYRFWIDQQNSMLLRSMLVEDGNKPVEQVIFTHIEFPDKIDIARFDIINVNAQAPSWLESKNDLAHAKLDAKQSKLAGYSSQGAALPTPPNQSANASTDTKQHHVSFSSLPMGYDKVSETISPMSTDESQVRHVMLSDGMASVSVYVQYRATDESGNEATAFTEGLSTMGAMHAYGINTQQAFITAVGEVPEATVRAIATAVVLSQ